MLNAGVTILLCCAAQHRSSVEPQTSEGIAGPPYRPSFTEEIRELVGEALSTPMPSFNLGILQRVDPKYHVWSVVHGKPFLFWFGTKARLTVVWPELVKEVLLNTSGAFERIKENPLNKHLSLTLEQGSIISSLAATRS